MKIVCKKDFYVNENGRIRLFYKKDDIYERTNPYSYYGVINKHSYGFDFERFFTEVDFKEYFYTEKELRKSKLEKIRSN